MKFPESRIAHLYLDGLRGLEIGAAAHNPFGLNTENADVYSTEEIRRNVYGEQQLRTCGEVATVHHIIRPGRLLPFRDKAFDFVLSSHVLEHCFDPIGTLNEWARVARRYVLVIVPHRDALPSDRRKPITPVSELVQRYAGEFPDPHADAHHTRWTFQTFVEMLEASALRLVCGLPTDDKVGNGMLFVMENDQ